MTIKHSNRLSEIPVGTDCTVHDIQSQPETRQRLREIGFNENAVIRMVAKNSSQLICEVHNTRIGMHRRIANDIVIKPAEILS
jgi:Fe2+ transport system protein FeoA